MKMKKITSIVPWFCLLILLFAWQMILAQGVSKTVQIGYLHQKVMDSADEGEGSCGWGASPSYWDGYQFGIFSSKAMFIGCKDFTDSSGTYHSVKITGSGQWEVDDLHVMMPVPDKDGYTIHRYLRYQPPAIAVDGMRIEDPYPLNFSDHVDPAKVPGTADWLIESHINSDMGLSVHQRLIAYTQRNHSKYVIREYTFKNTGNVDLDPEIELPNQTLKDVYFLKQARPIEEPLKPWISSYGEMPGDSLRLVYAYPQREEGAVWDNFGDPNPDNGLIQHPWFVGESILFASKSVNDMTNDDPNQPSMTGVSDCDLELVTVQPLNLTESQRQDLYTLMSEGFKGYSVYGTAEMPGSRPGHHSERLDERGYKYASEMPNYGWTATPVYAVGPYTLAPGDSFKVVEADVIGMISPEKAYEVGKAWLADDVHWGDDVPGGPSSNLPMQYNNFPDLYAADQMASAKSNWAKDCWVYSGKDSLFKNAAAAKWAYNKGFDVPDAPPAPSIDVISMPDRIRIKWGNESEVAADFAGFRVYRATGAWYPNIPEGENTLVGTWEPIFSCGKGTANALTHTYDDNEPQRGIAYYYYVTAFDDGVANAPDFDGKIRSLESSMFFNMTTQAAHLTKEAAKDLASVKIVPNPFNISASELQFTGEPNKIMFLNLPNECTIRIFTESGDLIKTIHHFGSGDESWGKTPQEHMATDSQQLIVSGIYIAHFQTPDGKTAIKKFVVVR
jgi:hypothetical protein